MKLIIFAHTYKYSMKHNTSEQVFGSRAESGTCGRLCLLQSFDINAKNFDFLLLGYKTFVELQFIPAIVQKDDGGDGDDHNNVTFHEGHNWIHGCINSGN